MAFVSITRMIKAPLELVFETVADIKNFSKAIPSIQEVEYLSEIKSGVGTKFRETRLMNKREHSTELEVTEFEKNERVRIVTDSHGTVWDTTFTTEEKDGETLLTLIMDARPHTRLARMSLPLTRKMIAKAIEGDMQSVKDYCETN